MANCRLIEVDADILRVCVAIPKNEVLNDAWVNDGDIAKRASKVTGVMSRRILECHDPTSLFTHAGFSSIGDSSGVPASDIDVLVVVTQTTPHQEIPSLAHDLHLILGLKVSCEVIQVPWGCSGYVNGLRLCASLLRHGGTGLLLAGDASSSFVDRTCKTTGHIFGDAVSATVIQGGYLHRPMLFSLGADGEGAKMISKMPGENLKMSGLDVAEFALGDNVSCAFNQVADKCDELDWKNSAVLIHQAGKQIISSLHKRLRINERWPNAVYPNNYERFGNCSSASIPLLIADKNNDLNLAGKRAAMLGFGSGWSWGAASVPFSPEFKTDIIEI